MPEATPKGITKVHLTDVDGNSIAGTGTGGPASIADGDDVTQGARADAAWDGVAASASVVAILKKVATSGASAGLTDAQLRASAVPVSGPLTDTQLRAVAVPVSGTFWQATQPISAAALPLPTGASTEATLALLQVAGGTAIGTLKSQLASAVAATSAPSYTDGTINPLSMTLAGALRVGGTVTATGPLTDTQLRATAVPVSGPLTDTQLRATAVPVSGTLTVNVGLTDTQLRASAVPVSLTSTTITGTVDVSDRAGRLLGIVDKTKLWDGTTNVPVKAASTAAVAADPALVVAISPNNTVPVSLAAAVDVSDRAGRLLGVVDKGKIWDGTNIATVKAGVVAVSGDNPLVVTLHPSSAPTAAQPVTGPLTDTQLRASAVPVSLTSTTITGTVDVSDRAARLLGVATASGTQARAAAITANPLLIGGRAANYPTKPTAVAAGQLVEPVTDLEGVLLTRPRQVATYVAIYRLALAAASSKLAFTFVANTDKQLATIHHAVGATKTVRIRRVWVQIISTGAVAGEVQLELRQLSATTAPATGNPAITPAKRDSSLGAAEATCLSLPGTAGSEVAANSPIASSIVNLAASAGSASGTGLVPQDPGWIKLYDEASADDEEQAPSIRAATAEGWAVIGRSTAAVPLNFIVRLVFTEE